MRLQKCLTVSVGSLLLWAGSAAAQTAKSSKVDLSWLRADAASKTVEFKLVAGFTDNNGGMNFNGFSRGGLVLTVPRGWNVVLRFKNEDPNLPHSVQVIPEGAAIPVGPGPEAFEHATSGRLEQGLAGGQGSDIRFVAGKSGSFLIFCAVPGHGAAGMWIRLAVSDTDKPALAPAAER